MISFVLKFPSAPDGGLNTWSACYCLWQTVASNIFRCCSTKHVFTLSWYMLTVCHGWTTVIKPVFTRVSRWAEASAPKGHEGNQLRQIVLVCVCVCRSQERFNCTHACNSKLSKLRTDFVYFMALSHPSFPSWLCQILIGEIPIDIFPYGQKKTNKIS
jgi:hypothetical protein